VRTRELLVTAVLLAGACTHPKPPPPTRPLRIQDSPPEQQDALNGAARLGLEAEQQRWQIEAAKELDHIKADQKETAASHKTVIPMPAPQTGGRTAPDGGSSD